jgi:hypothetical protein
MGEIADAMLDGTLDCETGEYLGPPCGYPRSANPNAWPNRLDIEDRPRCPTCGRRCKSDEGVAHHRAAKNH